MKKNQKGEFLSSRVRYIPINAVRPNPQQPRRSFDETALQELADSISAYGILQPLTVRDRGGVYELVAGERRLRAARIAGLREVPCLIAEVGEEDAALLALIENLQRRDLDYMEEAAAIARLIRRYGLSQQQAAEKLGKSQPTIANKLRLLRLSAPVIDCLRQYGLTERHARTLLRLTDPEQQLAAARHIGKRGLNVAQTEQYIDRLTAENRTEPPRRRPTYIIKDVRLFLNSVERGVRLMQSAGVGAEVGRRDTEEEILLTIHIPKRREAGVVTES
ncbi:MAG: ParB/RepB/Spo0J family partition protein [Oscillospiraceae bacterium]